MELFASHGFQNVTVGEIAAAAGVSERTFFRHFPTKEDVLFLPAEDIVRVITDGLHGARSDATPAELLTAAVAALSTACERDRVLHRRRAAVISSVPALRERDLLKQQAIAEALVDHLVQRRVPRTRAVCLAGVGLALYQAAYAQWVTDRSRTSLAERFSRALEDLSVDLAGDRGVVAARRSQG